MAPLKDERFIDVIISTIFMRFFTFDIIYDIQLNPRIKCVSWHVSKH